MKPRVEINKQCLICEIGKHSPDKKTVLCPRKGVVAADYLCSHFSYDPLKREPVLPKIETFVEEDFEL